MNRSLVSAAALFICCAIIGVVGLFGWSRYKAAQAADASFRAQLLTPPAQGQSALDAHMPPQIPSRATSIGDEPAPSPKAGGM